MCIKLNVIFRRLKTITLFNNRLEILQKAAKIFFNRPHLLNIFAMTLLKILKVSNRLNQTEPATFSILLCSTFFRDSVFLYFIVTSVLFVPCGGCKKSPSTFNQ
jgi:hypothetical protein